MCVISTPAPSPPWGHRMIVGFNPWRRESLPTAVFLPGEFLGHRSLAGYGPWDAVSYSGLLLPSFKIPYICVSILYWCFSFWLTSLCMVGKIPWSRKWQPTSVFLPGTFPWTEKPGKLQAVQPRPYWMGLIPGSGRSPGAGNGNPLQYSCLENPIDRGAWRAAVHGVAT